MPPDIVIGVGGPQAEVVVREEQSARLLEAGIELAAELSLPVVLQRIVDLACEVTADDERAVVVLAVQAGVAVANARLHAEAREREQRLDALRAVTAAILAGQSLDQVLGLVAARARELAAADLATIATPAGPDR